MIQLAPPLICDESHFAEIEQILRAVLTEAWARLWSTRRRPRRRLPGVARPQSAARSRRISGRIVACIAARDPATCALATAVTPRPALAGDLDVDVAIVGAGYTGLWTAYYLADGRSDAADRRARGRDRRLRRVRAQRRLVLGAVPASTAALARRHGRDRAVAMHRAMVATVDEVGRVAAAEGIDCDYAKGGTVVLARTAVQLERARAAVAESSSDRRPLLERRGGTRAVRRDRRARRHLHARLRRDPAGQAGPRPGRARSSGAASRSTSGTRVTGLPRAPSITAHGHGPRGVVVRATEGYTPRLPGQRRSWRRSTR